MNPRTRGFVRMAGRYFWSLLVITNLTIAVISFILWLVPDGPVAQQLDQLLGAQGRQLKFR